MQSHQEMRLMADVLRNSRWNTIDDPLVVCCNVNARSAHDFTSGFVPFHFTRPHSIYRIRPLLLPVHFTLKNYSDSHSIQFDFKMAAGIDDSNLDKFSSVVTPKV